MKTATRPYLILTLLLSTIICQGQGEENKDQDRAEDDPATEKIYYGIGILIALGAHQWLTTLCWVEEKLYGLIALGIGFFTTILWTTVWIVAAEAADKPQVMLNRNPLGFQRL